LQVIANPGSGKSGGIVPVDWSYQQNFIAKQANGYSNEPYQQEKNGFRLLASVIKQLQIRSNGNGVSDTRNSWNPGRFNAEWIWGPAAGTHDGDWLSTGGMTNRDAEKAIEALSRAWWHETNKYSISSIPRDDASVSWLYDNDTYYPEPDSYAPVFERRTRYYNAWRTLDSRYSDDINGVLDTLTTWAGQMWPKGNDSNVMGSNPTWNELIDYTPPSTGSQTIGLAQGWNLISSRINPNEPAVESVFGDVDSDLSLVKNEAGDIYSPEVGLNNIGDWQSREGYLVYMTNSQSMSVSGYGVDPTTSFMLEEGWNLIPYYPDTAMTPADAFASISAELVLVKNQAGETYVPDPQDPIDDIGQLQPGQAYKVYVSSPVSFSYPSSN
jgi:hypothetical protein